MLTVSTVTLTTPPPLSITFTIYPLQQNKTAHIHFTGAKYYCSSKYLLMHLQGLFFHLRSTFERFLTQRTHAHAHTSKTGDIPRGNKLTF